MFSRLSEYAKKFRMAAAVGDIAQAKKLLTSCPHLNFNEGGTDSGKTAAHLAIAGGHVEMIKFLYTCGVDFTRQDAQGHDSFFLLETGSPAEQVIKLIQISREAIEVARQVFPHDMNEVGTEESTLRYEAYHRYFQLGCQQSTKALLEASALVRARLGQVSTLEEYDTILDQGSQWNPYIGQLIDCLAQLQGSLSGRAGCGEMACVVYAFLMNRQPNFLFSIEQMMISDKVNSSLSHAVIVLNRRSGSDIHIPQTWDDAIVCDPMKRRIYFASEAEYCPHPILLKSANLHHYNIDVSLQNKLPTTSLLPEEAERQFQEEGRRVLANIIEWLNQHLHALQPATGQRVSGNCR